MMQNYISDIVVAGVILYTIFIRTWAIGDYLAGASFFLAGAYFALRAKMIAGGADVKSISSKDVIADAAATFKDAGEAVKKAKAEKESSDAR